jgi:cation:H+ antiporter
VCYITYLWAKNGGDRAQEGENKSEKEAMVLVLCCVMITGGLIMVVSGAGILVPSASEIAGRIGMPDDVIAATMVAFGTSVPELMTARNLCRQHSGCGCAQLPFCCWCCCNRTPLIHST